jgi:YD repeat-containing protein
MMLGKDAGLRQRPVLRRRLRKLSGLGVGIVVASLCAAGTATYTYDANGRPTGMTYDNGVTITYQMDANGNRTSIALSGLTLPSAPASETDSNVTGTSATVNWTAATATLGVTGYRYQINGGAWSTFTNELSQSFPSLTPGTTYTVNVEAEDASGNIGPPSTVTFTTGPTAPGTPTASNITGNSATVSWSAASDSYGVAGYSYQLNGGSWSAFSNVLSVNLSGLSYGTSYTVAVRAEDPSGNVGSTSTGTFTTGPTTPGTPTASGITGASATVSWTASSDSFGVTGYSYQVNGGAWSSYSNVLSVSLTGLSYGTTYTVGVRAQDNPGNISAIATGSFTTLPSAPGTPTASNITGTTSTVSWTAATDNNGVAGYSYQLNGGSWSAFSNVLSVNLTGLSYGTSYTIGVRAEDGVGNIGATASGNFVTPPSTPGVPAASNIAGTSATIAWTAATAGSGITGYSYQLNGGSWSGFSNVLTVNLTGLAYGTGYTVGVRAEDAYGTIGSTATGSFTTAPSAPGAPSASNLTPATATETWTAATGSVAGYRFSINGGTSWTTVGNVLSANLTGLAAGTAYTVLVEAENPAGNWGASSSGSFTTPSVYTDHLAFVGSVYEAGYNVYMGYSNLSTIIGSLTPDTTANGLTVNVFYFYGNEETHATTTYLIVSGFTSNPGASWLQSVVLSTVGTTVTGASAVYTYVGGGEAQWAWPSSTAAEATGSATMTIVHH